MKENRKYFFHSDDATLIYQQLLILKIVYNVYNLVIIFKI